MIIVGQVAESNDQILDSPSTSSSSKSREKSNTLTIQDDIVSNDNLRTNIDSDNDREQPVDVLSNINSAVIVQTSRSTEVTNHFLLKILSKIIFDTRTQS